MHNSMILAIGGTGTGKTNALLNYINRSSCEFHKIIVFSGSTTDEVLYNLLEENGVTLYNDIDELPELSEFEDDKDEKKLIVFDDFINIDKKKLKKINRYLISGRKFGFSVFLMAQNYSSIEEEEDENDTIQEHDPSCNPYFYYSYDTQDNYPNSPKLININKSIFNFR